MLEKLVLERFPNTSAPYQTTFYLFQLTDPHTEREVKEQLRTTLEERQFDRVIHGTDDWKETMRLAEVWTNRNSMKFLNEVPVGAEKRLVKHLSERLPADRRDFEFVIDAGATLELYGIRQTDDVDHICLGNHGEDLLLLGDCHSEDYVQRGFQLDDLIRNPRFFMRWEGYKFSTLENEFGRLRNLGTDRASLDRNKLIIASDESIGHFFYFDSERLRRAQAWRIRSRWQVRFEKVLEKLPPSSRGFISRMAHFFRSILLK
jgi:hypothetical protein